MLSPAEGPPPVAPHVHAGLWKNVDAGKMPCVEPVVPCIIDYSAVLEQMLLQGMICHYHNSGAFGFVQASQTIAWIGPDDPTIRPAARAFAKQDAPPYPATLAALPPAPGRRILQAVPGSCP